MSTHVNEPLSDDALYLISGGGPRRPADPEILSADDPDQAGGPDNRRNGNSGNGSSPPATPFGPKIMEQMFKDMINPKRIYVPGSVIT